MTTLLTDDDMLSQLHLISTVFPDGSFIDASGPNPRHYPSFEDRWAAFVHFRWNDCIHIKHITEGLGRLDNIQVVRGPDSYGAHILVHNLVVKRPVYAYNIHRELVENEKIRMLSVMEGRIPCIGIDTDYNIIAKGYEEGGKGWVYEPKTFGVPASIFHLLDVLEIMRERGI